MLKKVVDCHLCEVGCEASTSWHADPSRRLLAEKWWLGDKPYDHWHLESLLAGFVEQLWRMVFLFFVGQCWSESIFSCGGGESTIASRLKLRLCLEEDL